MNISYVKNSGSKGIGNQSKEKSDFLSIGVRGQIIDGIVTKIAEKVSINFNGREVKVARTAIQNPKEGELRKFEIMDVSKNGIVLREYGIEQNADGNKGILCTTVETNASLFSEQMKQTEALIAEQEAKEKIEQFNQLKDQISDEDYNDLEEEGMSLEKYEAHRLERAIHRIKEQRSQRKESLEQHVENKKEYKQQVEDTGRKNAIKSLTDQYKPIISQKLEEANLPVTEENINKVAIALESAGVVNTLSDKAVAYLLDNQLKPTIENVYHAQHVGSSQKYMDYQVKYQTYQTADVSYTTGYEAAHLDNLENAWEEVKGQAQEILEEAGIKVNNKNMQHAKWLFLNELPISKDNLKSLDELEHIKNNYKQNEVLDEIIKTYATGESPEQTDLGLTLTKNENKVKSFLNEVGEIQKSLENIEGLDIEQIKTRRQLEEIRLRMTVQAGSKLLSKGIKLDITGLENVINGLKEIEKEYYQQLLQEANVPETTENMNLLTETTSKLLELQQLPIFSLSVTLKEHQLQTINTLHHTGTNLKAKMDQANESYENLMTKPRKDLGDSIDKAFRNINELLEDVDMEITDANRRAVKILGYNNMEITKENINEVKAYDEQVNQVFKNLHPAVVVEIIKEGKNPLDTPIEKLNRDIGDLKEKMGITEDEKFSTFLRKLDIEGKRSKDGALSEEERKAFIGIYRMVHQIESSKGAAVGSVLNTGKEMTLNNLLTAVRTKKAGGIDKTIDDVTGVVVRSKNNKESITDQINYMNHVIEEISDHLSPDRIKNVIGDSNLLTGIENLKNENIEVLREELVNAETSQELEKEYGAEKVEEIRNLINNSNEEIAFLTKHNQPVTLGNLIAANQLMDGGKSLFQGILKKIKDVSASEIKDNKNSKIHEAKEVEGILNEMVEDMDQPEKLREDYDDLDQHMRNILDGEYENTSITVKDLNMLRAMSQGIELTRTLSHQENYYIPLLTGDTITNVNLTVVSGTKESGKVQLSIHSDKLGRMDIEFNVEDKQVKGYVLCNNNTAYETLSKERDAIKEALENLDLEVKQLDYGMDSKWGNRQSNAKRSFEKTDTKKLYEVAKAIIMTVKDAETIE